VAGKAMAATKTAIKGRLKAELNSGVMVIQRITSMIDIVDNESFLFLALFTATSFSTRIENWIPRFICVNEEAINMMVVKLMKRVG
jgi:hypothetical protein